MILCASEGLPLPARAFELAEARKRVRLISICFKLSFSICQVLGLVLSFFLFSETKSICHLSFVSTSNLAMPEFEEEDGE